ncbi:MAG: M48 family metallopeptidase [Desulfamplus sp.]|nr:M48 family metallopeptidase [Desulfamplus sp.]
MAEDRKTLQINAELSIEVVRKNIKNMHLTVHPPNGRVHISAPLRINDEAVRLFAISKIGWIRKHQRNFVEQDRRPPEQYKERESHYFQGRRYLLRIIEHEAPPKVVLKAKTYIELYVKPDSTKEERQAIINWWYRTELTKLIPPIIEKWEKQICVTVLDWRIKKMKTKWGTCNIAKKRIWLNLELAKKPLHCLEYVVLHEMIHLLERHHNDRFYKFMEHYLPQWKFYRDELNRLPISYEGCQESDG